MGDVSTLLSSARDGKADAVNQVLELLYGELRSLARGQLRRSARKPLDTTTLLHESYVRLLDAGRIKAEDRRHFLAYASHVMRSIVVDHARAQLAEKRGGGQPAITLDTELSNSLTAKDEDVLMLHEALNGLAALDERLAKVVEMRYFAGLTEQETADALQLSARTVQRDWEKARMYLATELAAD